MSNMLDSHVFLKCYYHNKCYYHKSKHTVCRHLMAMLQWGCRTCMGLGETTHDQHKNLHGVGETTHDQHKNLHGAGETTHDQQKNLHGSWGDNSWSTQELAWGLGRQLMINTIIWVTLISISVDLHISYFTYQRSKLGTWHMQSFCACLSIVCTSGNTST